MQNLNKWVFTDWRDRKAAPFCVRKMSGPRSAGEQSEQKGEKIMYMYTAMEKALKDASRDFLWSKVGKACSVEQVKLALRMQEIDPESIGEIVAVADVGVWTLDLYVTDAPNTDDPLEVVEARIRLPERQVAYRLMREGFGMTNWMDI